MKNFYLVVRNHKSYNFIIDAQGQTVRGGINPENSKIGLPVPKIQKFQKNFSDLVRGKYPF